MPRKPQSRPRPSRSVIPLGPTARWLPPPRFRARSSRALETFWQCLACGALVDPKYGAGQASWCPYCHTTGDICYREGQLPFPELYGDWIAERQRAANRQAAVDESFNRIRSSHTLNGDPTMKQKKTYTGTFHCPSCFIEFDLVAEQSLKCDQCGGPLAKGSLDEVWADEDDQVSEEDEE